MTTTTAAVRNTDPTDRDIAHARTMLARRTCEFASGYGYAFVLGGVRARIEFIAEAHAGCRRPDCDICRHLRAIGALLTAFDEVSA